MDPVVLIVDDNEDNRFTLSMRLENCGYYNLVTAGNGREAHSFRRRAEYFSSAIGLRHFR